MGSGIGQISASIFLEAACRKFFLLSVCLIRNGKALVVDFCCLKGGNDACIPKFIKTFMIWNFGL